MSLSTYQNLFGTVLGDFFFKAIWEKASPILGEDSTRFRRDDEGNRIEWAHYGNRDKETGWEIDHIMPVAKGGSDDISNLRPLQWKANVMKSDNVGGLMSGIRSRY